MRKHWSVIRLFNIRNSVVCLICILCFLSGGLIATNNAEEQITIAMVKQAQKIIGLAFSDSEADSMLEDLESQRKNFAALRKLAIPDSVAPVMNFNPLPVGYVFPDAENSFRVAAPRVTSLSVDRGELAFYNIPQLAQLVRSGAISSEDLTKYFIERVKKYNPVLLHTVTITEKRALVQARKADAEIATGKYRGLLHGIPFGVKDLLATRDYKTTWGSVAYKDQMINTEATVIRKLEDAGAVLIAKTSMGELAMGDVWFGGKTRNPWDLTRGSSGSSAGSASAVAAGCLPFAIGSETLGSIVSPSTECGTTGLRPTFGRVSKYGAMALSWSLDKLGPITRSVEDCAIVFNAIYGPDGKDLSVIAAPFRFSSPAQQSLKGVRIGYIRSEFNSEYRNSGNDSTTISKLITMGAELIPFELPALPYRGMLIVLSAESGAAFEDLTLTNRDDLLVRQNKSAWPNSFRSAHFIPAIEYIQANRARAMLVEQLNEKMKKVDVFIAPALGENLRATNLSGHPCVVLPNGFKDGRPGSITFTGQLFGEGRLLEIAQIYQMATDFDEKHPTGGF